LAPLISGNREIAHVIPVPVRRGDDLDVGELEAERFDIRLDQR